MLVTVPVDAISFFFLKDPAPPEIYSLSLHAALPIWYGSASACTAGAALIRSSNQGDAKKPTGAMMSTDRPTAVRDRKSTRLNSSHQIISYAVFCLKKKTH